MYGLIIESAVKLHLMHLKSVLDVVGDSVKDYNWMLSSYALYPKPIKELSEYGDGRYTWLDGDELIGIVNTHDVCFDWCVATAYNKTIALKDILEYPIPYADGYRGFWTPNITMQNPLADMEIVFWHYTDLLVFSKQEKIVSKFNAKYPQSFELSEYNIRTLNESIERELKNPNEPWVSSKISSIEEYKLEKYIKLELYEQLQAVFKSY